MAKLIIEGNTWKVQNLLSELQNRNYLGTDFKVSFIGVEIDTKVDHCICPPRKWYNPIAGGICVICGKPRR